MNQKPCASGAHFYDNCRCIGPRGLRHRDEDVSIGIIRNWDWYYNVYHDDLYDFAGKVDARGSK